MNRGGGMQVSGSAAEWRSIMVLFERSDQTSMQSY